MNIIDNNHSALSCRLVDKITASAYSRITALSDPHKEGSEAIEARTADVLLQIPGDLERSWVNGEAAHVLMAANAVNGTRGGLGSLYLSTIINDYGVKLQAESRNIPAAVNGNLSRIDIPTQNLFNPNLGYKSFMIPVLMVMLLTMLCGLLPVLNMVREKEAGTIEQANVTPVGKFTSIPAKLISYWLIGSAVLTLCSVLAWALYGIFPAGHFLVIYFFAITSVLAVPGLGLAISNHSATMQQAMFVMWFCMLILTLMSGLFAPVCGMPEWVQWTTMLNPLKYFMQVMRTVYLKGGEFTDLLPQLGALLAFALFFNIWAVKSHRKSG